MRFRFRRKQEVGLLQFFDSKGAAVNYLVYLFLGEKSV